MSDIERAAHELARLGVTFSVEHEGPAGVQRLVPDSPADLAAFARDPDSWIARRYGVERLVLLDWRRDRFCAYCCGKTSTGRPCRNTVPGGTGIDDPKRWLELQDSKCSVHQGRG